MKNKLVLCCAMAGMLLPAASRADETRPASEPSRREQTSQDRQDLPPREGPTRMRGLREQYGRPDDVGQRRPGQVAPFARQGVGRPGVGIERIMVVLTPEQRQSLRAANQKNREKLADLGAKLREARKAILEATLDKKFNEKALRKKLEAAAKLETELTLIRAKAFSQIEPPLSEEQIARLKNPPLMRDMPLQRQRQGLNRPPGDRPTRGEPPTRPRPDGPRDMNDLPPPANP